MDKETIALLENLSFFEDKDGEKIQLLLKAGLIQPVGTSTPKLRLCDRSTRLIGTWLHVTNDCNLDCPYCYIPKDGKKMTMDTARAYMDKLEDTFNRHSLSEVAVRIAGGEPTLERSLVEYIITELHSRFHKKARRITLVIITNGTNIDESLIELIKKHRIRLSISLDGMRQWHNKTRFFRNSKRGTFDHVLKNIQACISAGIRPNILTTITEDNVDGIEELNRFLVDSDMAFRYSAYRDTVGDYAGYQIFIDKLIEVLGRCYEYYACAITEKRAQFRHQLTDMRIDRNVHLRCCGIGHSSVTVSHTGQVFLCQSRISSQPIGNIWEDRTLLEMMHDQDILPELKLNSVLDYDECKTCQWALTCGGGCPVVNADTYGRATTASPYCRLFKAMLPKLIRLRALSLISNSLLQ
jgi:uncharacterized protein